MTKDRIIQIIDFKEIKRKDFFEKTGIKRGFLDSDKLCQTVSDNQLAKIIAAFPEINLYWLLLGEGEMLRQNDTEPLVPEKIYHDLLEKNERLIRENERLKLQINQLRMNQQKTK